MLAPFVMVLAVSYFSLLPPFLWGFALLAAMNTPGLLPEVTFCPTVPIAAAAAMSLAELRNPRLTLSMAAMGRSEAPAPVTGLVVSGLQCAATWLAIRLLL